MSSNQPSDTLPSGYHNLAVLLAQLGTHPPATASAALSSLWNTGLLSMQVSTNVSATSSVASTTVTPPLEPLATAGPGTPAMNVKRCSNPNCPTKGNDVLWSHPYQPDIRLCNPCYTYRARTNRDRPKSLCDKLHAKHLKHGRTPFVLLANRPYRDDENEVIFEVFSSLSHDASDKDKRNAALSASRRLGKGVRTGKRILEHMLSDSYKLWKAEYEREFDELLVEAPNVAGPSTLQSSTSETGSDDLDVEV